MASPARPWIPEEWQAARMTIDGKAPTAEEVGEYVKNAVLVSAEESGTTDFLFVYIERDGSTLDICHVGNGPTSPANARLIAAAPELYDEIERVHERLEAWSATLEGVAPGIAEAMCEELGSLADCMARARGEEVDHAD